MVSVFSSSSQMAGTDQLPQVGVPPAGLLRATRILANWPSHAGPHGSMAGTNSVLCYDQCAV